MATVGAGAGAGRPVPGGGCRRSPAARAPPELALCLPASAMEWRLAVHKLQHQCPSSQCLSCRVNRLLSPPDLARQGSASSLHPRRDPRNPARQNAARTARSARLAHLAGLCTRRRPAERPCRPAGQRTTLQPAPAAAAPPATRAPTSTGLPRPHARMVSSHMHSTALPLRLQIKHKLESGLSCAVLRRHPGTITLDGQKKL